MYNQLGGNVIWHIDPRGLVPDSWKAKSGQEYSVMEKELLIMLKVEPANPICDKIVKSGPNKGRVKKLSSWWANPRQKEPMTKSLYDIISGVDGYSLPEINLKLQEIIDRRTQDADKLKTKSTSKSIDWHHINYLESLKKAKVFTEEVFIDFIKNKHNTHQHMISPNRINAIDTRDVATRLSHDAPEFIPTPNICVTSHTPNHFQSVYPYLQYPLPDLSPFILVHDPEYGYYWLNTLTNETFDISKMNV